MAGRPSGWPGVLEKSAPLPTNVATSLGALSTECMSAMGSPVNVAMLSSVSLTCVRTGHVHVKEQECRQAKRRPPHTSKQTAHPTMLVRALHTCTPLDPHFRKAGRQTAQVNKQRKTWQGLPS